MVVDSPVAAAVKWSPSDAGTGVERSHCKTLRKKSCTIEKDESLTSDLRGGSKIVTVSTIAPIVVGDLEVRMAFGKRQISGEVFVRLIIFGGEDQRLPRSY